MKPKLLLLTLIGALLAGSHASAQGSASSSERALLGMVNATRKQYGLRPLVWDDALARAARLHATWILRQGGELEHQYRGEPDLVLRASRQGAHFTAVGENIARHARSAGELHATWMTTPIHRGNILSSRWNALGVGVIESGGLLYAVEDFADTGPGWTTAEIELAVGDALHRAGVPVAESSPAARALCERGAEPEDAGLTVTWDGPDPQQLPPALLSRLRATRFRSAEIGVCAGKPANPGFTTTRVAVLLH